MMELFYPFEITHGVVTIVLSLLHLCVIQNKECTFSAKITEDGLWYILGRADDIIKTSGHRIESVEIECYFISSCGCRIGSDWNAG